ncbi:MAG: hypothetical protein QOJ03_2080, partial [Frankiaceae bacterium]|nr:hypothetical protein [Frankiaceae bacterium]
MNGRQLLVATLFVLTASNPMSSAALTADPCGVRQADCGGVVADQVAGDFHGLIMVPGQPGVLEAAAHAGTTPGCGDCEWTLILACVDNSPDDPNNQNACATSRQSLLCGPRQSLFRLYLTTAAVQNRLVDSLCLGGTGDVVPVGDIAATDVERYLRDVRPPALDLTTQPPNGAVTGLPAYFMVRPPADLAPQPFGGGPVTETITITPTSYDWTWGDGTVLVKTDDAGAPYPDGTLTHTYAEPGHLHG